MLGPHTQQPLHAVQTRMRARAVLMLRATSSQRVRRDARVPCDVAARRTRAAHACATHTSMIIEIVTSNSADNGGATATSLHNMIPSHGDRRGGPGREPGPTGHVEYRATGPDCRGDQRLDERGHETTNLGLVVQRRAHANLEA